MTKNKFQKDRFNRVMKRIPEAVKDEVMDSLDAAAELVVETQRSYAPVDDGTLKASIRRGRVSESENRLAVTVEAGGPTTTRPVRNGQKAEYDYSLGVEFGTSDTPAQPFFYPGYRAARKRVRGRTTRAVKRAVKKALNK
ncbi:HK97-gp10 family putative phage morphogenesis protein [Aureimonas altamirensis]|uniref:HK97-gp10 family putative phage morphogenesis protein n=1 Tax=Aureimonas altamirensis TaxID=370622 RepID=UPI003018E3FB